MKIYLTTKADKQLKKLPRRMHDLLVSNIEELATQPMPVSSSKLVGRDGYRVRIGDYRILYTFDKKKKEITVFSVANRREAYKY